MPAGGLLDHFWCCCAATEGGGQVGPDEYPFGDGGASAASVSHEGAAFPLSSSTPRFPGLQEPSPAPASSSSSPSAAPPGGGGGGAPGRGGGGGAAAGEGEAGYGYGYGYNFHGQAAVVMSAEEKEREKSRLQKLVKEFAKEAVTGIAVSLVSPDTAMQSPHFFQMDRYLTVFSLQPKDGSSSTSESTLQYVNVRDLTQIYKGAEVSMRAPALGGLAPLCVGLDTTRADRQLFFYFDEPIERDKFYTCLKILRMSVDIHRSDHAPP